MAIRKRGSIWYIDYYAGGKRHVEAVGPLKKDAEAALGGIKKEIREGRWFPRKLREVPFDDLVDEYEGAAKSKRSYHVEKSYIAKVKEYFEGRLLSELTPLDVERFKADRKGTPTRGNRPRTGTAVNRELACLRAMLNKAVQWGMIEKNPAARVKMFPEPPGRNCFLTVEQAGRLLDACAPHLRSIVLCALETGMRKAEILGLRWSDIRNGMVYLPANRTKNGKPREVPVSQRLSTELLRLRNRRRTEDVSVASDLVFQPPRKRVGKRRGKVEVVTGPMRSIRNAWDTALEKAGIAPTFHFHDLRHTFASHQKMAGVDDYTLMELLGHSDFTMMKRYAHLTPEHKRKAVEMLPSWTETDPAVVPAATDEVC
ncbi:MAG: tyrosine-type recombinase/integrase [Thermodesulfobacteriota bacterium]